MSNCCRFIRLPVLLLAAVLSVWLIHPTTDAQDAQPKDLAVFTQSQRVLAWNSAQRKHTAEYVKSKPDHHALVLHWAAGAQRLAEVNYPGRPALAEVAADDTVRLHVKSDPAAAVRAMALRVVDKDGEIFQFGARLDAAQKDWQALQWTIDSTKAEAKFGDNRNGKLDMPLRLHGFAAILEGEPDAAVTLLVSDKVGDYTAADAVAESDGVGAAIAVDRDTPADQLLADLFDGRPVSPLGRGTRQSVSVGKGEGPDGADARKLTWAAADSRRLMEILIPGRPELLAFSRGVVVELPVNADDFPGVTAMALRVQDDDGETYQFPYRLDPAKKGWQRARWVLDPARAESRWGGRAETRGTVVPPARLLSLVIMAPEGFKAGSTVRIGNFYRNRFDAAAIEPRTTLARLGMDLKTPQPLGFIFTGHEADFACHLSNPKSAAAITVQLELQVTDYEGRNHAWSSDAVELAPGASALVPLAKALPRTGWFQLTPTLKLVDGSATLTRAPRSVAYVQPVGGRELPPGEDFYFGLDLRARSDENIKLVAQLGVDIVRYGTWTGVNPKEGAYRWPVFDADVKRIRDLGMQVLYSVTFTPDWAARESYIKRKAAGEKIATRPIELSKTAPRDEALRAALREIIAHTKSQGLHIYDLWNEPDLSGFWQGTTEEYLQFIRICHEVIKEVQPDATVLTGGIATMGGHGGHNLNPDLIRRMIIDVEDHYDAISVHQHGHFRNFHEGIDGPLADYRAQLKQPKPLWFTETGYNGNPHAMAQVLVQKHAFARARGARGFIWYALYPPGRSAYSMVSAQNEALPVMPAYNQMVRLMRGTSFAKQHNVGRGNWLFEFTARDDKRALLVGWDADADAAGRLELFRLPADASARLLNIMGDEMPMQTFDNLILFPLHKDVRYLNVAGASALESVGSPVTLSESPRGEVGQVVPVHATLRNPLTRAATFQLTWTLPDGSKSRQTHTLDANATGKADIELAVPAAASADTQPTITLDWKLAETPIAGTQALQVEAVRLMPAADPTKRKPDFTLDTRDHIQNPNEADPTRAHLAWKGPADLSASVWLTRRDDHILLRVDVTDDQHDQTHEAANSWQADGIQFAIAVPDRAGAWTLGLSRNNDGSHHVHAWSAPSGLKVEYADTIRFTSTPREGGLIYEAKLPLGGLGLDIKTLQARGIRFNLLVNDADNHPREGFVYLAKGLGMGKAEPDLWPLLVFE